MCKLNVGPNTPLPLTQSSNTNTSYLLLQLYRYTKSECCIFIRTKTAVEFEIYWDKTATGLMYQSDLLSFTDHLRLAVLCSAPSYMYFVGVSMLTIILDLFAFCFRTFLTNNWATCKQLLRYMHYNNLVVKVWL